MAEEIEAKVKVDDPEGLRRRMAARGAGAGRTVLELNRLFDDASGSLRREGAAVRVREERRPEDGALVRTLITYKGPRRPGALKRRPEFQTTVGVAAEIVAILEALGLRETFRFEKRRTAWQAGECEVVLDELPYLGWFAEVEGPTEDAVRATLADLGMADRPVIRQTYMRLLADCLARRGADPARAMF
ncbi:MAG: class IV adenylate cyclase [Planctomycetes bacterium]|nr:class IV adenylate cyclase [Planctomycetota bacterium]